MFDATSSAPAAAAAAQVQYEHAAMHTSFAGLQL
jgi:hypothetical protein